MNRPKIVDPNLLAWLSGLFLVFGTGASGCGSLEPLEGEDGGGGGAIPGEVVRAFTESCGGGGCHDSTTRAGGLSLAADDLEAIIDGPSSAGIPMVVRGDISGSYLAIKMLPDDILADLGVSRSGGRMPPTGDFTNPNNQVILAWVAGAEFPAGETGESETGESETGESDTETETDTDTGEEALTFSAAIWPILQMRCSCHLGDPSDALNGELSFPEGSAYAALVGAPSIDLPSMNQIEPFEPEASYLLHKVKGSHLDVGGAGVQMPTGGMLDPAEIDPIEAWIVAGAPE